MGRIHSGHFGTAYLCSVVSGASAGLAWMSGDTSLIPDGPSWSFSPFARGVLYLQNFHSGSFIHLSGFWARVWLVSPSTSVLFLQAPPCTPSVWLVWVPRPRVISSNESSSMTSVFPQMSISGDLSENWKALEITQHCFCFFIYLYIFFVIQGQLRFPVAGFIRCGYSEVWFIRGLFWKPAVTVVVCWMNQK